MLVSCISVTVVMYGVQKHKRFLVSSSVCKLPFQILLPIMYALLDHRNSIFFPWNIHFVNAKITLQYVKTPCPVSWWHNFYYFSPQRGKNLTNRNTKVDHFVTLCGISPQPNFELTISLRQVKEKKPCNTESPVLSKAFDELGSQQFLYWSQVGENSN